MSRKNSKLYFLKTKKKEEKVYANSDIGNGNRERKKKREI
jgi:hypothetical protein